MKLLKRTYEIMVVLSPELNEENVNKLLSQFGEIVSRHEGRVLETLPLGRRKLAYLIGRFSEGIYVQLKVELSSSQVVSVEKAAKLLDSCLRVMVTHEAGFPSRSQAAAESAPQRKEEVTTTGPETAKLS